MSNKQSILNQFFISLNESAVDQKHQPKHRSILYFPKYRRLHVTLSMLMAAFVVL